MFRWVGGILDRIFVVVGALLFSQAPLFMHQYRQQLAGHVAELQLQVEVMRNAALLSGKTLEQFVSKFLQSSDTDFSRQGQIMQGMVQRWHELSEGLHSLDNSSIWARPIAFFSHFNIQVAKSTLNSFTIGIPITMEGLIYAILGIFFGYALFHLIAKIFTTLFHFLLRNKKSENSLKA
jgi:Protein of unknown function (DUF2937)